MGTERRSLWERRGRIIGPQELDGDYRLLQVPTAWPLSNGLLRIAYSARDAANHGQLLTLDVDPDDDMRIIRHSPSPLLALEHLPAFARDGISLGDVLWREGQLQLFGSSIDLNASKPYETSIVRLTSDDEGESFSAPQCLLSPRDNDGYPVALPAVREEAGQWHLWYTAFFEWILETKPHPDARYALRHATSVDGLHWIPDGAPCIPLESPHEAGLARPTVRRDGHEWEMWFSIRGPYSETATQLRRYRIGYARSRDGREWQRHDTAHAFVNPPQPGDWDAEMQCYPQVFVLPDGRSCMLYCGNDYGAAGFGYAIRVE